MNRMAKTLLVNSQTREKERDKSDRRMNYDRERRMERYSEPRRTGEEWDRPQYRRNEYPENRFRDRKGRERYDDGRFAPMRSEWEPPYYGDDEDDEEWPVGRIGFDTRPESNVVRYPHAGGGEHEMQMEHGRTKAMSDEPMQRQDIMMWMGKLQNEDGTTGAHWSTDQVKQVMAQRNIDSDPMEFYAAINMMYSDYCKVFKKYGVGDKIDFYVDMTKAFLHDKDAGAGKLKRYYEYIVK